MKKYTIRHDKNDRNGGILSDGKVALGIVLGMAGVIITWLALKQENNPIDPSRYIELAPVIISLLVAMASIFLATNALLEQRKTREAGTDPVLVAHLGQRQDARELVTFNISNIGAGAALNVFLNVEKPNGDIDKKMLLTDIFQNHHPFTVILQGKSIEFNLAVGWEILEKNLLAPFQAKLIYQDLAGGEYESEFTIDVREMERLGVHKSPQMRMVTALEAIAKK